MTLSKHFGVLLMALMIVLSGCSGCQDSDSGSDSDQEGNGMEKSEVMEKVEDELELEDIESDAMKEALEKQNEDLIAELEGVSEEEMEEIIEQKKQEIERKQEAFKGSPIPQNSLAELEVATERWVSNCESDCSCDSAQVLYDAIMAGDAKTTSMTDQGGPINDLLSRLMDALDKCAE